jgi:hypothetical protein
MAERLEDFRQMAEGPAAYLCDREAGYLDLGRCSYLVHIVPLLLDISRYYSDTTANPTETDLNDAVARVNSRTHCSYTPPCFSP